MSTSLSSPMLRRFNGTNTNSTAHDKDKLKPSGLSQNITDDAFTANSSKFNNSNNTSTENTPINITTLNPMELVSKFIAEEPTSPLYEGPYAWGMDDCPPGRPGNCYQYSLPTTLEGSNVTVGFNIIIENLSDCVPPNEFMFNTVRHVTTTSWKFTDHFCKQTQTLGDAKIYVAGQASSEEVCQNIQNGVSQYINDCQQQRQPAGISSSLSGGAISGIVLGGVFCAAIIGVACYYRKPLNNLFGKCRQQLSECRLGYDRLDGDTSFGNEDL